MNNKIQIYAALTLATLIYLFSFASHVWAITIKEEQELSREFMKVVSSRYQIIDDPIIVDYVNKVGQKILSALPPQPFNYRFYVIKEDSFNAFASPAGHIFINSGLFEALESEEELAGIIGHEISHVVCRHISQRIERSKKINMATMAGMVAGIFLGAGGATAAGNAMAVGAMATGQSLSLSYSREDERQADEIGLQYLAKAGYGGNGLLSSLQKIRSKQWYGPDQVPNYLLTHPASEERMAYIDGWLDRHRKTVSVTEKGHAADRTEFKRIHTRMVAMYSDPDAAQSQFKSLLKQKSEEALALYGLGMLASRQGKQDEAAQYLKKALELSALDPYFLMELGRVYFSEGRYEHAVTTLASATAMVDDPDGKFHLARAQMELGKLNEAVTIFEQIVKDKKDYSQAYYYLGEAYGKLGKLGDAHFNLGIYYRQKQDLKNTRFHLNRALKYLKDPEKRRRTTRMLDQIPARSNRQFSQKDKP